MNATLVTVFAAYTLAVIWWCRQRWSTRCAECAYRQRTRDPAGGRHRPAPGRTRPRNLIAAYDTSVTTHRR